MTDDMKNGLIDQMNAEFYSSYLYLAIANWFRDQNLDGFGSWMEAQAAEEYEHAMKLYRHLHGRGVTPRLAAIPEPPAAWDSMEAAVEAVLEHERYITGRIHELADRAIAEHDHPTRLLLDWYVSEQVEEEATAEDILRKVRMLSGTPQGLFLLDREFGQRGTGAEE
jgi:ferritin